MYKYIGCIINDLNANTHNKSIVCDMNRKYLKK